MRAKIPIRWHLEGECFICTSHAINNKGYPSISRPPFKKSSISRLVLLHREHKKSGITSLPRSIVARHLCDRPACIRPDHLEFGTQQDNLNDMAIRGRSTKGERNPMAKLTSQKAQQIRHSDGSTKELSIQYGVSESLIRQIKRGMIWRG
jgi:hypothetical protein